MNLKSATANMTFGPSRADSSLVESEKSSFFWSKLSSYQKKLLLFLSVATFFEGYDLLALTQILPEIRTHFGLTPAYGGIMVGVINVGTILSYLLVRKADIWGRKKVMMLTILGYTLFSFLSGISTTVYMFAGFQLMARIFLIAEWAISNIYAAEEFPAEMRGTILGIIQGFSCLGAIACAAVVPLLLETGYGWRTIYFVGTLPLIILAFSRRNLKETARFTKARAERATLSTSMTAIFKTDYVKRLVLVSSIWALTYTCTQNAITFWKEFATAERGLTNGQIGISVGVAAILSMPLVFFVGKVIDSLGRKKGALLIYGVGLTGIYGAYTLNSWWALTASLVFAIFGASSVIPVLNAFTTELFPTHLRADAFAWTNNIFGRVGYVLAPVFIGSFAGTLGWGFTSKLTIIFPVIALIIILKYLPETSGVELEKSSSI